MGQEAIGGKVRQVPPTKLTQQQSYLLRRIPSKYNLLKGYEKPEEPADVKKARKKIKAWEAVQSRKACQVKKRNEAILRKAEEAVYFSSPEKALAIVRQCEKLLAGCPA